jgi:DNA-binding LytR/AlgR family response regulator
MKPILLICTGDSGIVVIPFDSIDYMEKDKDGTYINMKTGDGLEVKESIDSILILLENVTSIINPDNNEV